MKLQGSLLVAAIVSIIATPVTAGIAFLSQDREVAASVPDFNVSKSRAAPDFGPFTASVAVHAVNPFGGSMNATISQSSTLSPNAIHESGHASMSTGDQITIYRSLLDVKFAVGTPMDFQLHAQLNFSNYRPDVAQSEEVLSLTLKRTSPGKQQVLFNRRLVEGDLLDVNPDINLSFDKSGKLQPGTYELKYDLPFNRVSGSHNADYALSFSASRGPTTVPIPPAAWTGLATLALLAALSFWRRRHSVELPSELVE